MPCGGFELQRFFDRRPLSLSLSLFLFSISFPSGKRRLRAGSSCSSGSSGSCSNTICDFETGRDWNARGGEELARREKEKEKKKKERKRSSPAEPGLAS